MSAHHHHHPRTVADWEARYADGPRWSGSVNATLAAAVAGFAPGRALDLGAGEGGDACWLAEQGWDVVAAEWSTIAAARAEELARERGVAERVHVARVDLTRETPAGVFDLVCASFFMWDDQAARDAAIRRAAGQVRPGGRVVLLDHGSVPPGSDHEPEDFPAPDQMYAALRLGDAWEPERLAAVERTTQLEGHAVTLVDHLVVARRAA